MLQLRDILSQRNTTIAELVRQSGIPRRTIEEVLRRGDCRILTARLICDALGCTLDEFYTTEKTEE